MRSVVTIKALSTRTILVHIPILINLLPVSFANTPNPTDLYRPRVYVFVLSYYIQLYFMCFNLLL